MKKGWGNIEVFSWNGNKRPADKFENTTKELLKAGGRGEEGGEERTRVFCLQETNEWLKMDGGKTHKSTFLNAGGSESGILIASKTAEILQTKKKGKGWKGLGLNPTRKHHHLICTCG